ncbi:VOC family protein [Terrabacter aerolatus]|uniref:Glyoxalase n=1 Tax=Terrabacter aerolatus TaxID=422442 RepID=A0A512D5B3_9MICO|nr:VOC family protein [Terrabacter aerolatus]GEO31659.1 glyoxalase [Terrabacter aerolatus]
MSAVNTLIYPVADLDAAKKVFGILLGAQPHTDESYYVGYNVDGQEIALDPNGHRRGLTGGTPYWSVADLGASLAALVAAGATVCQSATEVGGGRTVAVLADADGNMIGLMQG